MDRPQVLDFLLMSGPLNLLDYASKKTFILEYLQETSSFLHVKF